MKILNKIIESFRIDDDVVSKGLGRYLEDIGLGDVIGNIKTKTPNNDDLFTVNEAIVKIPVNYFVEKGIKPPYIVRYFDHLVANGRLDEVVEIGANIENQSLIHGWLRIGDDERNTMTDERKSKYPTSRDVADLLSELDQ